MAADERVERENASRPSIVLGSAAGPEIELDGARVIYLGGTNYFGMSAHPEIVGALREAVGLWGISPGGGRTTSGTAAPHLDLEKRMETLLGTESVVLSASGYQANSILLEAFRDGFDACLIDELAHSSIREAIAAAGLPPVVYRHKDVDHLAALARGIRADGKRPLVCTDGVFPTDGALAPLDAYLSLAVEYELRILVDDAHGIGVLGEHGKGTPEHLGLKPADFLYTGSFSKAFGVFGGFASGPANLVERKEESGTYVGATPLPAALAVAARRSVDIVCGDRSLRKRLQGNAAFVKEGLRGLGLEFPETPMPIARFLVGNAKRSRALHDELRRKGILIPFNRYPGGPGGGYFRLAVSAAHTPGQLEMALDTLQKLL